MVFRKLGLTKAFVNLEENFIKGGEQKSHVFNVAIQIFLDSKLQQRQKYFLINRNKSAKMNSVEHRIRSQIRIY